MARVRTAVLVALALVAASPQAHAWGFQAHRMVNRRAIGMLPEPLRGLFSANADYVEEHAIDPDLWRGAGVADEGPNHFLDMDEFGNPPPELERIEARHLARFGKEAAAKGRVPWRVGEVYGELVTAFRARDMSRVLERASVLGHYVGDAHVPLHAVTNYDGQLSGQTGVHGRWEKELIERFQLQIEETLATPETRPVGDPVVATQAILRESFDAAAKVLESDRLLATGRDLPDTAENERYDDAYYTRFFERERNRLKERLERSYAAVASFWLQAWEEAGRPALDPAFKVPYVRKRTKAILVSLDGSSGPIIEKAIERGVMPHLARLRSRGASTTASLTTRPAKTAPGHAALFTGAWSDVNGITGNDLPVPGASIVDWNNGYSSTHLRAEPLWVTAARQGLAATVVSAPQVYPFGPYLEEKRFGGNYGYSLTLFDGYQNVEGDDQAYAAKDLPLREPGVWLGPLPSHEGDIRELQIELHSTHIDGLLYDDPRDPTRGYDTLYLGLDRDPRSGITLKALPARGADASAFAALPFSVGGASAALHFRLFALAPDGSQILLYRTAPQAIRSSRSRLEPFAFEATGGFVGNGAKQVYERGELGPPLWEGGDGTAEKRYLETVALVARQLTRLSDFALDKTAWDLLVTYLPYPDEALHMWLGRLDAGLPGHDAALASRLWPYMDQALGVVDGYAGHLVEQAGENTIVAVGADHGMEGAGRVVRPNVALAAAGIVALDATGHVDVARSTAVYFSANSSYVLINRVAREGGVVPAGEEEAVRRRVKTALKAIRDPSTGKAVVLDVWDARVTDEPATGGATGGDLYLSVAPGYELSAQLKGALVDNREPEGVHGKNPERPGMHAIFIVRGPGVSVDIPLGAIRQIDIAPTLCALLGIDPPAQAKGRVLSKALARPLPTAVRDSK
jgi:predicted AlkP superfamily phosphohydrolase/phosphomutase